MHDFQYTFRPNVESAVNDVTSLFLGALISIEYFLDDRIL